MRAFEGPELAEYFSDDETISAAMARTDPPTVEDWTVEAMMIEALQPERTDEDVAIEALDAASQQIVNVEVDSRTQGDSLVTAFEEAGYRAAYFRCNCRCHDGHVLARDFERAATPQSAAPTDQTSQSSSGSR